MRWGGAKFALFAAIFAALVPSVALAPAAKADPVGTTTVIGWRSSDPSELQPSGPTKFYVRVTARSGNSPPTGTVLLRWNGTDQGPSNGFALQPDPGNSSAAITPDISLNLADSNGSPRPHYFIAQYKPQDSASFSSSANDLGIGIGSMSADPEPSREGEAVTYSFLLSISPQSTHDPIGRVAFGDDQNHGTDPPHRPLVQVNDTTFKATWTVTESPRRPHATAIFIPGDDVYLPAKAERDHNVTEGTTIPGATTTPTLRSTTTRLTVPRRAPTTAALAPISPSSTALAPAPNSSTTQETFGDFQAAPPSSTDVKKASDNKRDGPPLAVVVLTLGALGVVGGIGAVRRYRNPRGDWF